MLQKYFKYYFLGFQITKLIICTLILINKLFQYNWKVFGSHDVFMAKLLLKSVKFHGSPRFPSLIQRRSVQLVAELVRNNPIIFRMHNHHRRTEFGNVLIRLKSESVIVNWLQNCRLEPWQVAEQLSKYRDGNNNKCEKMYQRRTQCIVYVPRCEDESVD